MCIVAFELVKSDLVIAFRHVILSIRSSTRLPELFCDRTYEWVSEALLIVDMVIDCCVEIMVFGCG
jgi:hypothetical protein